MKRTLLAVGMVALVSAMGGQTAVRNSSTASESAPNPESVEVLVDRMLARPDYIPDPRVRGEDWRTPLLQAIAARGEAGAAVMVARLLAMPSSAENPQGTKNNFRWQLVRDVGALGDVAVKPLQDSLARAKTPLQRRELTSALGAVQTAAGTRALLGLLAEKDDTIRHQAISSLANRLGARAEQGGSDDILQALAKILPGEKDDTSRWGVCARVLWMFKANPPAEKPQARQVAQAADMMRDRLKNDTSASVRLWAAMALTEIGDNSGLMEMEKATLAMQSGQEAEYDLSALGFPLERLIPALERATGQNFGPVPLNPMLSSDSTAGPRLKTQRQALLDKVAAWIKANPASPTNKLTAVLPSGVEIELVAVSYYADMDQPWWRPDGTPLSDPPIDPSPFDISSSTGKKLELVFRLGKKAAEPGYESRMTFADGSGLLWTGRRRRKGLEAPELLVVATSLPANARAMSLDLLVAAGPWESVATSDGSQPQGPLSAAKEAPNFSDHTTLITAFFDTSLQVRVVGTDKDGATHVASPTGIRRTGRDADQDFLFSRLPPAQFKSFALQTRPYELIHLKDISIVPGQRTDARLTTAPESARE